MASGNTIDTWAFFLGATNFQLRFDYDGNGNQIYIGWAVTTYLSSDTVWRIMKQTFNGANQVTQIQWANGDPAFNYIWDNRTTYTYS